jgi:hypothetical protein
VFFLNVLNAKYEQEESTAHREMLEGLLLVLGNEDLEGMHSAYTFSFDTCWPTLKFKLLAALELLL